jgi:SWI/SNF-related matrix-associated actin-dependent regulator of chromatin subfamily A-like protein 1
MRIIVTKHSEQFVKIRFPNDPGITARVKSLIGWVYLKRTNAYKAIANKENLRNLNSWGATFDKESSDWLNAKTPPKNAGKNLIVPGLKKELYPFQKDGVAFLETMNGRALIGDECRLGKTIQALAWLQLRADALPALVVCPNAVKINWERETRLCTHLSCQTVFKRETTHVYSDVVIINYDILADAQICSSCKGTGKNNKKDKCRTCKGTGKEVELRKDLAEVDWKTVIVDEAHRISKTTSQRTRVLNKLTQKTKHFIALSATPLKKKPVNFFNILHLINPREFPDYLSYVYRYCGAHHSGFGMNVSGSSHTDELYAKVQDLMIRRHKKDVLPDLPEKNMLVVPMGIDNRSTYEKADADFTKWVRGRYGKVYENGAALVKVGYMQKLASDGKLKNAIEWIIDLLESVDKVVLFAIHTETVGKLITALKAYNPVRIYGKDSPKQRDINQNKFQTDPTCRVLVGNIQAAGEGIELSAASDFVFLEYYYDSLVHEQAGERGLSINQKSKEYNIWWLVAADTIEEEIVEILDNENQVIDAVLDGKKTSEANLISTLLRKRLETK